MDEQELRLRHALRRYIKKSLKEISTTAGVPGYLTPKAFVGDKHSAKQRIQKVAKSLGYSLTKRGAEDAKPGDTLQESYNKLRTNFKTLAENYYYEYKKDESALPHQKIGRAISEINKQMKLVERMLHFNNRLKNEYGISNEKLWKRTQNQMTKLEGRLMEMARRLREMRS